MMAAAGSHLGGKGKRRGGDTKAAHLRRRKPGRRGGRAGLPGDGRDAPGAARSRRPEEGGEGGGGEASLSSPQLFGVKPGVCSQPGDVVLWG